MTTEYKPQPEPTSKGAVDYFALQKIAEQYGIDYNRFCAAFLEAHHHPSHFPASQALSDLDDWRIDNSAGRPILVYKNCSVIEAEQAELIMRLLAAAGGKA